MEKLVLALVYAAKREITKIERHARGTQYHIPAIDICAGLILTSPEGTEFTYALRFQFTASNNEAEYEALIAGLRIAAQMRVHIAHMSIDSKLVANQVLGTYVAKEENMIKYLEETIRIVGRDSLQALVLEAMAKPTMHRDVREVIRKCKDCQIHRPVLRHPQQPLTPITAPWPFYKWGIDIAGSFSKGPGKVKFLHRVLFHKVHRGKGYRNNYWQSIKYPQSNRLVERANRSLGEGIKAHLGKGNKNWLEELPHVLWAHRMIIKSSNDDTPFSLTYGTEAVIPVEIGMPTYRTTTVDAVHNDEELWLNLDLLEVRREGAAIREAKAKLKMTKY
nr:reverse transcriptase domain-containing protein [Tanacetum cinerariifolium]